MDSNFFITSPMWFLSLSECLEATNSSGKSLEPIPRQYAPAFIHLFILSVSVVTPPVGIIFSDGHGANTEEIKLGPYTLPGKSFTNSAPYFTDLIISESVPHPGIHGT